LFQLLDEFGEEAEELRRVLLVSGKNRFQGFDLGEAVVGFHHSIVICGA
jgi:hypothetical protein